MIPALSDQDSRGVSPFRVEGESVSFWLRVKPHSARQRLSYDSAGGLRLEVQAAPSAGAANEACLRFFARALRLPQACVTLQAGATSRRKLIRVTGRSAAGTVAAIQDLVSSSRVG